MEFLWNFLTKSYKFSGDKSLNYFKAVGDDKSLKYFKAGADDNLRQIPTAVLSVPFPGFTLIHYPYPIP